MSAEYKETFFITPYHISELQGLTLGYLKVYATIYQFWNKGKTCFLSNAAITERTGVSDREVFRALNFFEKHNQLSRKQIGQKRYLMQPSGKIETDSNNNEKDCQLDHPPLSQLAVDPCPNWHTEVKNLNKEVNTTSNSIFSSDQTQKEITPVELIQIYRDELPDNPMVIQELGSKKIDHDLLRQIKVFKEQWPHHMEGEKLTMESFRRYLLKFKIEFRDYISEYETKGIVLQNGLPQLLTIKTLTRFFDPKGGLH